VIADLANKLKKVELFAGTMIIVVKRISKDPTILADHNVTFMSSEIQSIVECNLSYDSAATARCVQGM